MLKAKALLSLAREYPFPVVALGAAGVTTVGNPSSWSVDDIRELTFIFIIYYLLTSVVATLEKLGDTGRSSSKDVGKKIDRLSLLILDTHQFTVEALSSPVSDKSDDQIAGINASQMRILESLDTTRQMIEAEMEAKS